MARSPGTGSRWLDFNESDTNSFIVKIWLEERDEQTARAIWRGRITHVPSGDYRYFKKLEEVAAFIGPYLLKLGVRPE